MGSTILTIPQAIPYQGSKRRLAPEILRYVRVNDCRRLVEPFAGSAAVSLAAAAYHHDCRFWINDAHEPLYHLWCAIVETPGEIADCYERLWHAQMGRERAYFDIVRERFNKQHDPADFLYLLARCVKAAVRYNSRGEFNNTPDNRRCGVRPFEMRRRITVTSELLRDRVELTSSDYRKVLERCTPHDIVYMDPPYQGVCGQRDPRYMPRFCHDRFCKVLLDLNRRRIRYAISYDGRTGSKTFGSPLPGVLNLQRIELCAGRSTQATLLGRSEITYESLYLSPALLAVG